MLYYVGPVGASDSGIGKFGPDRNGCIRFGVVALFQRRKIGTVEAEKVLPPDHPGIGTILGNVGRLYREQDQHARAEPLLQRALAIREKVLGPGHPDTAIALNNPALLYPEQGQYRQAETLLQRALMLEEKVLPPDHPSTAITLENYAKLLREMNRTEAAAKLEKRAKVIRAKRSS